LFGIKNYKKVTGLSFRFFDDNNQHKFEVAGPYGKGLIQNKRGTHVAFAAGTGVFSFIDLVAYLAIRNLRPIGFTASKNSASNVGDNLPDNDFKFVLYVSFPNRKESIALDFC